MNSRCEEIGMFENGRCKDHEGITSYKQCSFRDIMNSRCEDIGMFENGRCKDHEGIIQCPISNHTLTPVGGQELAHHALLECSSPECRQSETTPKYRYCDICENAIRMDFFCHQSRHPCAKEFFVCYAVNIGEEHIGSILNPVDGQELAHGALLECSSPECRQSETTTKYRYCDICENAITCYRFLQHHYHPCAKDIPFCHGRNLGEEHTGSILYPVDGQELAHGVVLKCSFPKCRQSGRSYIYCGKCKGYMTRRSFGQHAC